MSRVTSVMFHVSI